MRETKGTETSKYLQEKKEKSIPKVVASEIGRAQTRRSNSSGVEDCNKLLKSIVELFWKSRPKRVKVSYTKKIIERAESRVRQDTRNPVGSRSDH